jgi:hypothetical protein
VKNIFCICLVAAAGSVGAFASQPIATVSGSSSFELDGSLVNTAGVTAWPLMPGDRVVARDSALVIAMKDGSRLTLAANSQLRFESAAAEPTANLISGSMQFTVAPGSVLRVLRDRVPVGVRSGSISVGSAGSTGDPRPMFVTPPKAPTPISVR